MAFKPGQSGNPNGRPRVGEALAEYVRSLGGPDARAYIDQLHALATIKHDNPGIRIKAIELLMDRGWGKPTELHEHVVPEGITIRHIYSAPKPKRDKPNGDD